MLSRDDATALVAGSRLFDERWYAKVCGRSFGSREEAAAAWVAEPGEDAPHPLFEPLWLYPGGAWRRHAPDPLSFYLSRAAVGERPPRSPHPLYDVEAHGPLEDWLAEHLPAELLVEPAPREPAAATAVVQVPTDDVRRAVRWVRQLGRLPAGVALSLQPARSDVHRLLTAVSAQEPLVLLGAQPAGSVPVVAVDPGIEPPRWPWLPALLAALDHPGVAAAQPVLLDDDFLLTAPALVGHPVSAVERLDAAVLPQRFPGVEARTPGASGAAVLVTGSWVVAATPAGAEPSHPGWAALRQRARSVEIVEHTPSLRWAIDIAAGAAPIGRRWGDWYFARSLADALERLGQWVEIDHPETRGRATRGEDDVVLTLRGLDRVSPTAGAVNLLWVISHPEDVTAEELAGFDVAFAASTPWAERHGITPLLQCTDATRFHPGAGSRTTPVAGRGADVLFVGNARGGLRPVVAAARAAGVEVSVIGTGWGEHGIEVVADRIANQDLPAAYASAGVVLNDHHADMRSEGFVTNRVFDVLAVGGRLLTDPVAGLDEVFTTLSGPEAGGGLPTWQEPSDLARLTTPPYDAWPDAAARLALAERVVAEHSFDARARTLLDAALSRSTTYRRPPAAP